MREGSLSGRATIAADEQRPDWRDKKRYLWLLGAAVPAFLFAGWGLVNVTGLGLFWWMGPIFVYVIIPVLDLFFGDDPSNPPEEIVAWLDRDRYYRFVTYAFLPIQYVAFFVGFWLMTRHGGLPVLDRLGIAFTLGSLNGIAINTAHELGHKKEHLERWFARIALAPSGYGHFFIEHNRGHHVRVATPDDPASSRLGESFWAFWPRTVPGSLRNSWRLEKRRLRRMGKRTWTLRNDVLNAWAMTVVLWAALIVLFGVGVAAVPAHPGGLRVQPAGGRELSRALRPRPRATAQRPLGAGHAKAQLEQQPRRHEPVPVPAAAAQRPSREPDPPLPGAAPLRGVAAAAQRVRHHDRAVLLPAAVAPRDGSPGARALRRRRDQGQHPPAQACRDRRPLQRAGNAGHARRLRWE